MHRLGLPPLALAALLPFCASSAAAVLDATASGFTIENSRDVPVDAEAAWKALVGDVDRWWPKDHTWWGAQSTLSIDARAGGCFCERVREAGAGPAREALHMTVTFVEAGKLMRMVGGLGPLQGMGLHGAMEWRIAAAGEGRSKITLWYRAGGYAPDDLGKLAPVVDQVQGVQLGALADYLAAGGERRKDG
ncbi:SRPBCC family protein [Luteimonas aquatica]|uniref:SRPBCC family protein n=1 Tax=Luteimonas aquatica TaxID=450364 RepID=UPI001F5AC142|nr:SRPBCC family protein [Luteimonas aquatica]